MTSSTVSLYSLPLSRLRTYIVAVLFVAGNMLLPWLCHHVPNGGRMLLPIYFFTLIGAYKYGWRVGLLTALLSPLLNSALFGMPPTVALPAILVKSTLLAVVASLVAARTQRVSIGLMLAVVLAYQLVGSAAETLMVGSLQAGLSDFTIGLPGMVLQVVGGYALIKYVLNK